jgi:hypothetical protein
MTPADLRNYRNWLKMNPAQVLQAVKDVHGWAKVFPDGVPCWASRVRNYFNVTPNCLMRFDGARERENYDKHLVNRGVMAWHALHGAVYKDPQDRVWLQMSTAAAVYHYTGEVNFRKKALAYVRPQAFMPIFKLVSPDGTEGSRELILTNPSGWVMGDSTVVDVLHWKNIRSRVVTDERYAGSYNYSETITVGYSKHELRDVDSHRDWPGFYLNPGRDEPLEDRMFPERDGRGAIVADQVKYPSGPEGVAPLRGKPIPRGLAASHLPPVDPETL